MQDSSERTAQGPIRLEVTVHPGRGELSLERVADLDLDRLPDPEGGVRLLVAIDDAVELVSRGYEVRLVGAVPVQPLDVALVADDDSVRSWLEEQVGGIERDEGS